MCGIKKMQHFKPHYKDTPDKVLYSSEDPLSPSTALCKYIPLPEQPVADEGSQGPLSESIWGASSKWGLCTPLFAQQSLLLHYFFCHFLSSFMIRHPFLDPCDPIQTTLSCRKKENRNGKAGYHQVNLQLFEKWGAVVPILYNKGSETLAKANLFSKRRPLIGEISYISMGYLFPSVPLQQSVFFYYDFQNSTCKI